MNTILVTRPETSATYDVMLWRQAGFEVILAPLLTVNFVPTQLPYLENYQSVITTSVQAILALAHLTPQRDFPLWCVGQSSAKVAADCGFQNIFIPPDGQENAFGLANAIAQHLIRGRLLYICGKQTQFNIVEFLTLKDIQVDQAILYETQPNKAYWSQIDDFCANPNKIGVTFYSQRTAQVFKDYASSKKFNFKIDKGCWPLTLSHAIADHIQAFFYEPPIIASTTKQLIANLKRNVF